MSATTLSEFLADQRYVSIQMQKNAVGHFEVQARINGKATRLIVDTGASHTVISLSYSEQLNIDITESNLRAGGVGTSEHAVAHANLDSLVIGELVIPSFQVGVIDLSHVNDSLKAHGAETIDGVIGGDLMSKRSAVIDYQHAILYLLSYEINMVSTIMSA